MILPWLILAVSATLTGLGYLLTEALPQLPKLYFLSLFLVAYALVAWPTLKKAVLNLVKGKVFTEYLLMSVATLVAFVLGEFTEAVAVMLFYETGEHIQHLAVHRARRSIAALLDQRPDVARVLLPNGSIAERKATDLHVGDVIEVRRGEKLPADCLLLSQEALINTAALTGEPTPKLLPEGSQLLAGMLNEGPVFTAQVSASYRDSRLSKILELVHTAGLRKASTERFISRFAKYYTPAVSLIAVAVALLPALWVKDYELREWIYRGLIFLVISCPCALLISIPLGFFGGIGAASRRGILFKGSDFLDRILQVNTLLLDKTGTLTQGEPAVQTIVVAEGSAFDAGQVLHLAAALEAGSTHPLARAVIRHAGALRHAATEVQEQGAAGMSGIVDGHRVLAGNERLLSRHNVPIPDPHRGHDHSDIFVAIDGAFAGIICLEDPLRPEAAEALNALRKSGIARVEILSGDSEGPVAKVAQQLNITVHHSKLLPEDKYRIAQEHIARGEVVAFVGDGINDAPVLALAHVGIAMGGAGSDAALESADVVIHGDDLRRIALARTIARATRRIVWQNITLALGVKALVLVLGALGHSSLWAAIFADVGVALLAILNAMRLGWKRHY